MALMPIKQYCDFWDFPRMFLTERNGVNFLFDCKFDDDEEDYDNTYAVYIMPNLTGLELAGSWNVLSAKALKFLGDIPVNQVVFDETRRQSIEDSVLLNYLA